MKRVLKGFRSACRKQGAGDSSSEEVLTSASEKGTRRFLEAFVGSYSLLRSSGSPSKSLKM